MPTLGLAKQDLWGLGAVGESFWQKESLLQYTITLLQGPKDLVLPTLAYTAHWLVCFNHRGMHNSPDAQSKFIETFIRIKFIYSEKATKF